MNTNMNMTMNVHIYIQDEHKRAREREYEHDDEDGDKHEQLREDDVGFFSGLAAEAAGLGIRRPRGSGVRGGRGHVPYRRRTDGTVTRETWRSLCRRGAWG